MNHLFDGIVNIPVIMDDFDFGLARCNRIKLNASKTRSSWSTSITFMMLGYHCPNIVFLNGKWGWLYHTYNIDVIKLAHNKRDLEKGKYCNSSVGLLDPNSNASTQDLQRHYLSTAKAWMKYNLLFLILKSVSLYLRATWCSNGKALYFNEIDFGEDATELHKNVVWLIWNIMYCNRTHTWN